MILIVRLQTFKQSCLNRTLDWLNWRVSYRTHEARLRPANQHWQM